MDSGHANLFFIPILAEALRSPSPKEALLQAFQRIRDLGQEEAYKAGLSQFERFMQNAMQHRETLNEAALPSGDDIAYELSVEIASDTFLGDNQEREAALDLILSRQEWRMRYEDLRKEFENQAPVETPAMAIVLERENASIAEMTPGSGQKQVRNIQPGRYALRTSTGRVIWRGDITERELLWTAAYPDRALDLAASTEDGAAEPTAEYRLLDGEMILRVFAGVESGRLEITSGE